MNKPARTLLGIASVSALLFTPARAENLAVGGSGTLSTTGYGGLASRGNDGNRDGNYGGGSVFHSDEGDFLPTYTLDLGSSKYLDSLFLWNRTDAAIQFRFENVRMEVFNDLLQPALWSMDIPTFSTPFNFKSFAVPYNTFGRYVKVSRIGPDRDGNPYLSLAELEVYGSGKLNVARNPLAAASQSSTDYEGDAFKGNDGIVDGNYFANTYYPGGVNYKASVTHTVDTANSFWQVALGSDFTISTVDIFRRTDPGTDARFGDFRVSVWDDGSEIYGQTFSGVQAADAYGRFSVSVPGIVGDLVRIQNVGVGGMNSAGEGSMSVGEVEVFAVPEPASVGLLVLGAGLLAARRRKSPHAR